MESKDKIVTSLRKKLLIELAAMLGIAFAVSILLGFVYGGVNWIATGFIVLFAVVLVLGERLAVILWKPPSYSPEELKELVEQNRLKWIQRLGWRWEVCAGALCKLDNKTGETLEKIDRQGLTEVWGVNTDAGPFSEDFWLVTNCGGREYAIGSELWTDDIRNWFFALPGFDHDAFSQCMACTDNRRTLLWKRTGTDE